MKSEPVAAAAREAARQQALVDALLGAPLADAAGVREQGERQRRGLSAYRANAESLAARALAAACPTVLALLGEESFERLAQALWRASPPRRGDLAQWGAELPALIESQRDLDPWPFLADVARLDFAVQACESAADAELDRASLGLLAEQAPEALRLRLMPCVRLLESPHAITSIRAAHRRDGEHDDEALRAAITSAQGERVVVARAAWRAEVHAIDAAGFAWMRALDEGRPLTDALAAAAEAGPFEFDHWLAQALPHGWLWRAEPHHDHPEENLR